MSCWICLGDMDRNSYGISCHSSKFHETCIYLWYNQYNNKSCPICRSVTKLSIKVSISDKMFDLYIDDIDESRKSRKS